MKTKIFRGSKNSREIRAARYIAGIIADAQRLHIEITELRRFEGVDATTVYLTASVPAGTNENDWF